MGYVVVVLSEAVGSYVLFFVIRFFFFFRVLSLGLFGFTDFYKRTILRSIRRRLCLWISRKRRIRVFF